MPMRPMDELAVNSCDTRLHLNPSPELQDYNTKNPVESLYDPATGGLFSRKFMGSI